MEPAASLLATLRREGYTVTATGEGLRVSPKERLTPELRALIRQRRDEVLTMLRAEAIPAVCSWTGCGQPVGPWEPDLECPSLEHRLCKNGHRQRDPYWRQNEPSKGITQ